MKPALVLKFFLGVFFFFSIFFLKNAIVQAQSCPKYGTYHVTVCVQSGSNCILQNKVFATTCQRGTDSCRAHVTAPNEAIECGSLHEDEDGGFSCPTLRSTEVDYWTYCGDAGDSGNCCQKNCAAANRQGSCTLPSGASGYNCPKECEEDGGDSDPPPKICDFTYTYECKKSCPGVNIVGECEPSGNGTPRVKCKTRSSAVSCKNPQDCTPGSCPAGTSENNEGGTRPLAVTKSCTRTLPGACDSSGKCKTGTRTRECYSLISDPPSSEGDIIIDHASTTALGCFGSGSTGKEVNNTIDLRVDLTDPDGFADVKAFLVWFGTDLTPPTITEIAPNGTTPLLQSNSSYGFMIGNYGGTWRVFIPRYNAGNPWTWVNANSIGAGERGRIKGESGKDLGIIQDVVVTDLDSDTRRMTAKLEILHNQSGVADFESPDPADYKVFVGSSDTSRFFQGSGSLMAQAPVYTYIQDWTVDVEPPTREDISHTVVTADRLNLNWEFNDLSGIKRVVGDAEISSEGESNGPIENLTSGVSNYTLGSGDSGSDTYGGDHLWTLDADTREELIDIGDNEGGAIDFVLTAFDGACNAGEYTYNMELGEPWLITKGGVVFSSNGTDISVKSFSEHERFSADSYWSGDFGFYKDESDVSTELLSGGGSALNALINNVKLSSVRATGYNDRNNRSEYWFDELSRRFTTRLLTTPDVYTEINFFDATTLSGETSDIIDPSVSTKRCNTGTSCVVKVAGDLNIEEGYSCNTRTTFLVDGNVTVNPDMTTANKRSGCMFVTSGNITIAAGTHKSGGSNYPKYDIVEGYFLADGQILIPEVDQDEDVRDGLKVNGSLIAFGGSGTKSILMGRTLKLIDNNAYPALAIHFDNRYLNFATTVFGGQTETFKREVGFKPL